MIARLQELLELRKVRLRANRQLHALKVDALAVVERELAAVDDELQRIDRQRAAWEHEWQGWLRRDDVVRHGQDYNLLHLQLSAWEKDVREQRAGIAARHWQAAQEVSTVRQVLLRAQQSVELLESELTAAVARQRRQREAVLESRASGDLAVRAWVLQQEPQQ